MRFIFLSILIANLSFYGWRVVTEEPLVKPYSALVQEGSYPTVEGQGITLLAEVGSDSIVYNETSSDAETLMKEDVSASSSEALEGVLPGRKPLCRMVGPFPNDGSANAFLERLAALDVKARANDIELSEGERYWVYLMPLATREKAERRLVEIQRRGIDSYVIPKGKLKNGISLGMFSQVASANAKMKEMKAQGLDPQVEMLERSYHELWVLLEFGEDKKIGASLWKDLLKEQPNLDSRQSFCVLDVASDENFH